MAKFKEKIEAHKLRRLGKSVKGIAKTLKISKSTISLWCSEIKLSPIQKLRLHKNMVLRGHKGRMIGAAMQKDRRLRKIDDYKKSGAKEIGNLSNRDVLMVGLGLHLGEGSKTKNQFRFTNSSPDIIKAIIKWLAYFGITRKDMYCNVLINEIHRTRETSILNEWSKITKIPLKQFNKTTFIKAVNKKIYKNSKNYIGTLSLQVYKSSELQYRVLGLMNGLLYKLNGTKPA